MIVIHSLEETRFPFKGSFTISRGARTHVSTITLILEKQGCFGWAEAVPYPHYGESVEGVIKTIHDAKPLFAMDHNPRKGIQALPAGAARNALDCALWDLEAQITQTPVWQLANLSQPKPHHTALTLSLSSPSTMGHKAAQHHDWPLLKLKLGTLDDLARLEAVHKNAPKANLIVDANEGWSRKDLTRLLPHLTSLGVKLIEQPCPASQDDELTGLISSIPLCADESCHDLASFKKLNKAYCYINVKLDKTGGLTHAIDLIKAAKQQKLGLMLGCMAASSLAMAPALLLAQDDMFIDLDGPLLLKHDREHGLTYDRATLYPTKPELWGYPRQV